MLRHSFIYSTWLYARAAILAASTIYLARELMLSEYGTYISTLAIIGFFIPFMHGGMAYVFLDSENLLGLDKKDSEKKWINILLITGPTIGLVSYVIINFAVGSKELDFWDILIISITEITLFGLCEINSRKNQILENSFKMGYWQTFPHFIRLAIFVVFIELIKLEKSIEIWIYSGFVACLLCLTPYLFKNKFFIYINSSNSLLFLKKSIHFGIGGSSVRASYEVDKPIVSKILSPSYTATLSISQRLMDIASIPANSISSIALTRMLGAKSTVEKKRYFKTAFLQGALLSAIAFIAVYLVSPFIINYIGPNYSDSLVLISYLFWYPFTSLAKGLLGSWLASEGDSDLYALHNFIGLLARTFFCVFFVNIFGVVGAIYSLFVSDLLVISMMGIRMNKGNQ